MDFRIRAVTCSHDVHAVPDSVTPGYVDVLPEGFTAPPLLAEGVLKISAEAHGAPSSSPFKAIGLEEMQTMSNLAIPCAIGYSAGLINYFFRGQLTITPPPVGLYAVLDHGKPHSVNAQGYPCVGNSPSDGCTIFGFTQVQMNIQNTTPDLVESGSGTTVAQRITNGRLVAVMRYHRDTCYQRDLSGAIGYDINSRTVVYPSNCPDIDAVTGARTAYPEIAVSAEIPIDANGMMTVNGQSLNINSGSALLVRFDFSSDPIPVNATDVFLQVAFRGNLGNELDGIAVGNIDVSEPSYVMALNMTDYMIYKNQWLTPADAKVLDPILGANPFNVSLQTCIDDHLIAQHGDASGPMVGLPPAQSVRDAALLDPNSTAHRMSSIYSTSLTNHIVHYRSSVIAPHFAQAGMEQNPADGDEVYTMLVLYRARNVNLGDSYDYATVGYQPNYTNRPQFPAAALPLDNEGLYRPIAADNLYLNNPAPQICNQQ